MHTPVRHNDGLFDLSKLPTLPQTLVELIDACDDREANLQTVGEIVGKDAAISARILQLANSAFLGTRTSFANTEQAVIYLGIDTVRNLAISVSVHEAFQHFSGPAGMSLARFWHHSLLTAVLAKTLAQLIGYPRPAEAYLAGLLHDLGKLLLAQAFAREYRDLAGDGSLDPGELEAREKDRLGLSHSEAGSLLIDRWHLQAPIAAAIESHHRDTGQGYAADSLAAILFLANSLSMFPPPDPNRLAELAGRMSIAPRALTTCLETADATVAAIADGMGIAIEKPLEPHEDGQSDAGRKELADKVRTLSRLHGVLDNLVRAEDLDRTLRVMEESLHILFNITDCLVFLPDLGGRGLRAHGSGANSLAGRAGVSEFTIAIEDSEELLRTGQGAPHGGCTFLARAGIAGKADDSPLHQLFSLFGAGDLLAIALPATEWCGLLVAAVARDRVEHLHSHREELAFFARHAAARLHLEVLSRQRAEELAKERIDAVQQVARSIAHEINNPLAVVQNYLSILANRLTGRPEVQNEIRNIGEVIDRIGCITQQLDDLSEPPVPPSLRPVDLNALIGESLDLFQHSLFARQGIASRLDADPRIPHLASNPGALRQILANLLKNAAEALGSGGEVRVRTRYLPGSAPLGVNHIRVTVEDNGPGIEPRLAETLFSAGVTGKGKGHLGLGLAIVRKLVMELGGEIACSSHEGEGTCFTLSFVTKN